MAFYILAALLVALVASALLLHYGFALTGLLPEGGANQSITDQEHFQIDYTFFLNLAFLAASGALAWLAFGKRTQQEPAMAGHGERATTADTRTTGRPGLSLTATKTITRITVAVGTTTAATRASSSRYCFGSRWPRTSG